MILMILQCLAILVGAFVVAAGLVTLEAALSKGDVLMGLLILMAGVLLILLGIK